MSKAAKIGILAGIAGVAAFGIWVAAEISKENKKIHSTQKPVNTYAKVANPVSVTKE